MRALLTLQRQAVNIESLCRYIILDSHWRKPAKQTEKLLKNLILRTSN